MTDITLSAVTDDDHPYDFSDSFSESDMKITQTRYYEGDGFVLAVAELNFPNHWDDERFEAICRAIEAACGAVAP